VTAVQLEKLMALTAAEFAAGLSHLGGVRPVAENRYAAPLGDGRVLLAYSPEPPVRLGGLLSLPRARIVLVFEECAAGARADFLRRFDLAFQRGGG
jgi:hypothetical protein